VALLRRALVGVALGAVVLPVAPVDAARPGLTTRVSVSSHGAQANGPSALDSGAEAHRVSLSANGRYVAFGSGATNLVAGDTNKLSDLFVHDSLRGTTVRVSVSSSGEQGIESFPVTVPGTVKECSMLTPARPGAAGFSAPVGSPALTADGRLVAFTSCFTNLVTGDTNAASDVFVHDVQSGTTTRISLTSKGAQTLYSSWGGSISDDGHMVVFSSQGNLDPAASSCPQPAGVLDLLPSLCGDGTQVFAHDMKTGRTVLVSATPNHLAGDGPSEQASVSPDGRYAVFISRATNLVAGQSASGANPPSEVYLRDLVNGTTTMLSVGIDGAPSDKDCGDAGDTPGNVQHVMSADDRYVVFGCLGTNLVPNYGPPAHNGNAEDLYVKDLRTGWLERVSVDSAGGTLNQDIEPSMSRDGRVVAFYAGNPPGVGTFPWQAQLLLHDRITGATEFISVTPTGEMATHSNTPTSSGPDLSADGRYVAFASQASDLVHGDSNGFPDVFVRDRGRVLGVGGLAGAGRLTVAGAPSFGSTGVVTASARTPDTDTTPATAGTKLAGASVTYRPASADLFVRLKVSRMPAFAAANPAVVYGLDLTVGGVSYQVRAAKVGVDAAYGLFALHGGIWIQVAQLSGGYGTTGQQVVVALPLRDIGAAHGGEISDVRAFSSVGTYLAGAVQDVDAIRLAP
jgi:Tol biopolymer transport system component